VDDASLAARRAARDELGWEPLKRERPVSAALRAYASMALSADKGAARLVP
jgi:dihydroxy-acid dehydratase